MDTSDVTKCKSEDDKETVHYSLDVCKSQDTSCSQTQLKRLYKSENESEVFSPTSKRVKTVQILTLAESEILKQPNDKATYDSRVYGGTDNSQDDDGADDSKDDGGTDDSQFDNGTDDSEDDNGTDDSQNDGGTDDSQFDNGTDDSQDDDGTDDSHDDNGTDDSQDDGGTDDSQDNGGTDDSQVDNGTDDSQDDDGTDDSHDDNDTDNNQDDHGSDDGHEDICYKQDEADLFYGTHETQVSEGGEADLHKHLVSCKKNPGHIKFVPVIDFNINHLPEGYHDNDLVELIKAAADLTVRVDVKMTSTERPEFWPNTTVPYAFYNMRGSDVMRVGTGTVWDVNKLTKEDIEIFNMGTCRCHKCQHSDTPSEVWGEVKVHTAKQVVFGAHEARHTTCRLFFDGQDSPLVTLDGWTVDEANIKEDWCELKCVTCDVDLLDKLDKMWDHWRDLWLKVNNKYKSSRDEVKLIFIVSHPHGCPKQISIGQWIDRYVVDNVEDSDDDEYQESGTKYTYTTCTCPGSSGARVHSLGYNDDWYYALHVHSGVNSKGNNFSGVGREGC